MYPLETLIRVFVQSTGQLLCRQEMQLEVKLCRLQMELIVNLLIP